MRFTESISRWAHPRGFLGAALLGLWACPLWSQPAFVGETVAVSPGSSGNVIVFDYLGTGSGAIAGQARFVFPTSDYTITAFVCRLPTCTGNTETGDLAFLTLAEVQDTADAVEIVFDAGSQAPSGTFPVAVANEEYLPLFGPAIPPNGTIDGAVVVDRQPMVFDDSFNHTEDGGVLTGSVSVDNGSGSDDLADLPVRYSLLTPASKGVLNLDPDSGTISYAPQPDRDGMDSATYSVTDADGDVSNTATISIYLDPAPDPTDDLVLLDDDSMIVDANVTGNQGNGSDDLGSGLGTVSLGSPPTNADFFELRADGGFDYVPDLGFDGTDAFSYWVTDANGDTGPSATVEVVEDDLFADQFEDDLNQVR